MRCMRPTHDQLEHRHPHKCSQTESLERDSYVNGIKTHSGFSRTSWSYNADASAYVYIINLCNGILIENTYAMTMSSSDKLLSSECSPWISCKKTGPSSIFLFEMVIRMALYEGYKSVFRNVWHVWRPGRNKKCWCSTKGWLRFKFEVLGPCAWGCLKESQRSRLDGVSYWPFLEPEMSGRDNDYDDRLHLSCDTNVTPMWSIDFEVNNEACCFNEARFNCFGACLLPCDSSMLTTGRRLTDSMPVFYQGQSHFSFASREFVARTHSIHPWRLKNLVLLESCMSFELYIHNLPVNPM